MFSLYTSVSTSSKIIDLLVEVVSLLMSGVIAMAVDVWH